MLSGKFRNDTTFVSVTTSNATILKLFILKRCKSISLPLILLMVSSHRLSVFALQPNTLPHVSSTVFRRSIIMMTSLPITSSFLTISSLLTSYFPRRSVLSLHWCWIFMRRFAMASSTPQRLRCSHYFVLCHSLLPRSTPLTLHVIDIWRVFNPGVKGYSKRHIVNGNLKQSRVDYCLISTGTVKDITSVSWV